MAGGREGLERALQAPYASLSNKQGWLEQKPTRRRGCRGGSKKKKRKLGEGIFNLTSKTFSQEELLVLDKGIKYALTKSFNQFEAFIDLQKFVRKLNLKKTF